MSTYIGFVWTIARKDLLVEFRTYERLTAMGAFVVLIGVLFNFSIDTADDGRTAIRFGLASVKNVGPSAVADLVAARTAGGAFSSLEEFARRAGGEAGNRRVLESLIRAGALDTFAHRGRLLAQQQVAVRRRQRVRRVARGRRLGQAQAQPPRPRPGGRFASPSGRTTRARVGPGPLRIRRRPTRDHPPPCASITIPSHRT